jgi:hypothetical protein
VSGIGKKDLTDEQNRRIDAAFPATRTVRVRTMSQISMRPVDWLWRNRIALGKINQLAGAPGQGKSQLTCLIAALVTTGELEGELFGTPRHIVIASAEDDPEDTITPRLLAAGADPEFVHILDMRVGMLGREVTSALRLPQDALPVIDAMKDLKGGAAGAGPSRGDAAVRPLGAHQPARPRCARPDPRRRGRADLRSDPGPAPADQGARRHGCAGASRRLARLRRAAPRDPVPDAAPRR